MIDVIILAGGLGTRLRSSLVDLPKSMAPIQGRPFLEFQMAYLQVAGLQNIILSVGYLKEHIISYFGNRWNSLSIKYSTEDEPLGTGGAIKKALLLTSSENILILNGDTFFEVDLERMMKELDLHAADAIIALRQVEDAGRYGLVELDDQGRISNFREKDPDIGSGLINGGIYLLNRKLLEIKDLPDQFSVERELFPVSCKENRYFGMPANDYFIDIGIPEDLERAQKEFHSISCRYGLTL